MKKSHLPGVLLPLLIPACAIDGFDSEASTSEDNMEFISDSSLEILAQDAPVIRGFVADGSGCRSLGNPIVSGNTVTIILTDYIAAKEGIGLSRSTCDVAVEIDLPPGLSISLDDVIYRGFSAGSKARSTFFREYFVAGEFSGDRRFTVVDYNADGAARIVQNDTDAYTSSFGEFTGLDRVLSLGRTRCGEDIIWRANTALTVRNEAADSFSLASIDTVDAANRFHVTFDFGPFRSCN